MTPIYMASPPPPLRAGVTFEANLGLGWIWASDEDDSDTSDLGFGGLSLGIGGWVSPKLAITGRIAGVTIPDDGVSISHVFVGPSLQYWVNDHVWLGGGAGLSVAAIDFDDNSTFEDDSVRGFGLDLRIGYTFTSNSKHTFNASLELNPGWYDENGSSTTFTGIGLLLGYQYF